MEDLLRRHRRSKRTGFSLFGSSGTGDGEEDVEEERFSKQMRIDIEALRRDAEGLGVNVGSLDSWRELGEVLERPAE